MKLMTKNKRRMPSIVASVLLIILIFLPCTSFAQRRNLVPVGKTVGVTVGLEGVFVVNTAEFEDCEGKMCCPASDAGILPGDIITNINGENIKSAQDLEDVSSKTSDGEMLLTVKRNDEEKQLKLTAKKAMASDSYKLGLWIKDSSSGIGTLTYYDPETLEFGALGHGICDTDSNLTAISNGVILNAEVASIKRGEKGCPGELIGVFTESGQKLGEVISNTSCGISGKMYSREVDSIKSAAVSTAERSELHEGDVSILSNIEGVNIEEYSAEIVKINKDTESEKSFVIKITDKGLIEKTGGIVRGMSGSPILQDGKLVGAITHVFVNDPTRGYGIFIENMLVSDKP